MSMFRRKQKALGSQNGLKTYRVGQRIENLEPRMALDAGGLMISEFLAANQEGIVDQDGDRSDWIEIYNSGDQAVNLQGWSLTDDKADLTKWQFPTVTLDPGQFLLVFASGKNLLDPAGELHTNFRLAADGEYLALVGPEETIVHDFDPGYPTQRADYSYGVTMQSDPTTLISSFVPALAIVPQSDAFGSAWTTVGFDDSGWTAGTTGVGLETSFEDYADLINTTVPFGTLSAYVRVPFEVSDASQYDTLTLRMKYDDGFVAYLNGTKIASANAPANPTWDSFATTSHPNDSAVVFEDFDISAFRSALRDGANVLAIQALNVSTASSDLLVLPELVGSQAVLPDPDVVGYFGDPSPGRGNDESFLGFVDNVQMSHEHGFYDAAFSLEITTATADAVIRYTTNGDEPTETSGQVYTGPITIDTTTPLRVRAFKPGYKPTDLISRTYLFVDDIARQSYQSTINAGFPQSWGGTGADYGMDPDVVGPQDRFGGKYAAEIGDALKAIPTLSIVMDTDEMFGPQGIYTNSIQRGLQWERMASVELIHPDGSEGFQVNSGIRIMGGWFRQHSATLKHSLRLLFKDEYGPSKLEYPFFGPDGADEFDSIAFRANTNDAFGLGHTATRNQFMQRSQNATGSRAPLDNHVHIYINGIYWGLYNAVERPDAENNSEHFGGDKEEYDVITHRGVTDGTDQAWNQLKSLARAVAAAASEAERTAAFMRVLGRNPDGTDNPEWESYLNAESLIDYMIVNFYGGNADWPHNNYYVARQRGPESEGFRFFTWDAEHVLGYNSNLHTNRTGVSNGVAEPYGYLVRSEEFRLMFADHIQKHFSPGGAFYVDPENPQWDPAHPERNVPAARYAALVDEIDEAIVAESARWGDMFNSSVKTRDETWLPQINNLLQNWFPYRSQILLDQFRSARLLPMIAAPEFEVDGAARRGGRLLPGEQVELRAGEPARVATTLLPAGSLWKYHDDGANLGSEWRLPSYDDAAWSSGRAQLGYGDGDETTTISSGNDPSNKHITTYFRTTFNVQNADQYIGGRIRLMRDDGAVVYLNGQEIARSNMPSGAISYNTTALSAAGGGDESSFFEFSFDPSLLKATGNVLAVELHQSSGSSSDTSFDLEVLGETAVEADQKIYYTTDGSDPRLLGGAISPQATLYEGPLTLTQASTIRARVWENGKWSAIDEAMFTVGAPAAAENIAIVELNYNPVGPSAEESAAGFTDGDQFEFIELLNVGDQVIDLTGLKFTAGVAFDFADGQIAELGPGERVLVVSDTAAFTARYGEGLLVAGQFSSGNLANDGERLMLVDGAGATIHEFRYDDADEWPVEADGRGSSLEIVATAGDYGSPANWRASATRGGTPGHPATVAVPGDIDGNRTVELADFLILKSNFGLAGATLPQGDLNGDEKVDLGDFIILRANFGTTAAALRPSAEGNFRDAFFAAEAKEADRAAPVEVTLIDEALAAWALSIDNALQFDEEELVDGRPASA